MEVLADAAQAHPLAILDLTADEFAGQALKAAILERINDLDPHCGRVISGVLARTGANSWVWMLAIHHLSSDGWSQHLYGRTFSAALSASSKVGAQSGERALCGSSIDYAMRQQDWFKSDTAEAQLHWWIEFVSRIPPSCLPLPIHEPACSESAPPLRLETRLESATHVALRHIAVSARVPMLAVTFAAYAAVAARRTGRPQVSALSLVGGRTLPGADRATGAFYNSIVLSIDVSSQKDEAALIRAAAASVFEGWKRQEVPLSIVSQACVNRGLGDVLGKIPVTFNLVRHPLAEFRIPGCQMSELDCNTLQPITGVAGQVHISQREKTEFFSPITVIVCELADGVRIYLDVDSRWFDPLESAAFLQEYADGLRSLACRLDGLLSPTAGTQVSGLIYAGDGRL